MVPNKRFTISIPSKDLDLIEFIEEMRKCESLSSYIRRLIRQDMENRQPDDYEQIYQYVEKRLKESGLLVKSNNESSGDIIDNIDKEIILDLF
jgi:hypothetical protein